MVVGVVVDVDGMGEVVEVVDGGTLDDVVVNGTIVDVVLGTMVVDVVVTIPMVVLVVGDVVDVVGGGRPQSGGVGSTLALHVFRLAFAVATHANRHALPAFR